VTLSDSLVVLEGGSTSSLVVSGSRDCTARLWDARCKMPLLHVFQVVPLRLMRLVSHLSQPQMCFVVSL